MVKTDGSMTATYSATDPESPTIAGGGTTTWVATYNVKERQ